MHTSTPIRTPKLVVLAACLTPWAAGSALPARAEVGEQPETQVDAHEDAAGETPPAAEPHANGDVLEVTVTGVEGIVQARTGEDQPWRAVEAGMVLPVGAEFRTGPRSAVRFTIPPAQVVTLDRLGTIKVLDAIQTPDRVTTNLGMKYGRTRYNVEAAGLEYETTIATPSATLAVRGTDTGVFDQPPYVPYAWSLDGSVNTAFHGLQRAKRTIGGTQLAESTAEEGPAEFKQSTASTDPVIGGFDGDGPEEDALERRQQNLGGDHLRTFQVLDNQAFARHELFDSAFSDFINQEQSHSDDDCPPEDYDGEYGCQMPYEE